MSLSTHVLDTAGGQPAIGVDVVCDRLTDDRWVEVSRGTTDDDGRIPDLLGSDRMQPGPHRLTFDTGGWYAARGEPTFWHDIVVAFEVTDPAEHHHVPLLLSPYGYSTYRGT
ncbi:MAG TPA: hydroxyisourate hydrolase [Euzebya sp.]|nr:hydroxyisourate hydrolase [Euzebya sp.]